MYQGKEVKREHILAVKTAAIQEQLTYNQLTDTLDIDPRTVFIGHRDYLDNVNDIGDPDFLQAIGYAVIKHPQYGILAYQRKGSEGRLNGKISIGFGGHTSIQDIVPFDKTEEIDLFSSVKEGLYREIEEEVYFSSEHGRLFNHTDYCSDTELLGYIACDKTPVDKLHLGFVSLFTLHDKVISAQLGDHGKTLFWIPLEEIKNVNLDDCEEWTKIVLATL
jgi:predicted NUDIX family phosphoesterase